jgi:hypothetical protein
LTFNFEKKKLFTASKLWCYEVVINIIEGFQTGPRDVNIKYSFVSCTRGKKVNWLEKLFSSFIIFIMIFRIFFSSCYTFAV